MRRSAVDLEKLGEAFWNAFSSKRMGDAKRHWDEIMQTLAVGDDKVADSKTGEDEDIRVAKVPEQLRAVVAPTKDLRFAMIADGETVLPKMTVCVIDNVAYAADGTNEARMANGICVRAGNKRGEIYWRPTGVKVLARVKRNTGVDTYGVLYQSGTPGVLTNDPNEVGLAYVQQVAHFRNWEIRRDGQRPSIAEVDIMLSGRSGSDAPVTSVNGETGDVVLNMGDLNDVDDSDKANGSFLQWVEGAGQYLAVSIAASGAFTPTLIESDEIFTVPANTQVLFVEPIDAQGALIVEGALVEVD